MDNNIVNELYRFPVEKRLLYFPITDKYGNVTYEDALTEGKNKVMGIVRKDKDILLGVCSEKYKIIDHNVVKQYADDLINRLEYKVSSAKMELPNEGSTMLYFNILDDQSYMIGNKMKIKAVVECRNSYNGTENASINVVFVNQDNSILGFGFKRESKVANSVFIKHHGKATEKVETEFGGLIEYIPNTIKTTVSLWNKWDEEYVPGERIKLICRGISAGFAKYCKDLDLFETGSTRFWFYALFCKYNLNMGTIGKYYKSQKQAISKMNNLFLVDSMYDLVNPEFALKVINKVAKFEYDELGNPNVKKLMNSRTYNAIMKDTVDKNYQVNEPTSVIQEEKPEQIKEPPTEEEEKIVPLDEPVLYEKVNEAPEEEEDPNKLLAGW